MEPDALPPVSPLSFVRVVTACPHVKELTLKSKLTCAHMLPSIETLSDREVFAEVAMGWSEEALYFVFDVDVPLDEVLYPDFAKGDSIELFIDTRDIEGASSLSRFCHHFFFLPYPVQQVQAGEITRLRADQSRPMADPSAFAVEMEETKSGYKMAIRIDRTGLFGYSAPEFDRLGLSYRINRFKDEPQIYSSTDFKFASHPNLWAQVHLSPRRSL